MSYQEKQIEKKYYSIGEVAKELDVNTSQIRFWESEFDIISPQKNRSGKRKFTREDIDKIKLVYHLVKEKGYTLQGAKTILKNGSQSAQNQLEMIEALREVRSFLVDLKQKLE